MPLLESITQVLKDPSRPIFLFGSTPPREGTSVDSAKKSAKKFAERSAVLAIDGFIIYDIQDEEGRTTTERPFPFRKTIDAGLYASFFPQLTGKQCVVYKCVADQTKEEFIEWLNRAADEYGHVAYNLVGAASSKHGNTGISLPQAAALTVAKSNCAFGCVAIPERHTAKGNETTNMLRKIDIGAEWFITQGVFASEPVIKLICQYSDLCRERGIVPKKVVLTFAPCGRPKTMQFIKWLGMFVPEAAEKRIFESSNPVRESLALLNELLIEILEQTGGSGVPLGVNIESLSIFKEEIDAAHELFHMLQATLLNHRGSPWSVRWFDLKKKLAFTAAYASSESLQQLQQIYATIEDLPNVDSFISSYENSTRNAPALIEDGKVAEGKVKEEEDVTQVISKEYPDIRQLYICIAAAGLVGFALGRLSVRR
jgi:hypothetical protein